MGTLKFSGGVAMKKVVVAFLLATSLPMAHAGEYVKCNGILSLSPGNGTAKFNINASRGDASSVCNMEGLQSLLEQVLGREIAGPTAIHRTHVLR
ncbi:hypothetical protein [Photorhabdus luminescens]|uniref:hypothetical protein n=1 Tax=Photorhabdus luminescens TaxID=29488 RepID=UPI0020CD7249|nr:hypothetical protein [Photorhabdus luminescens]